MKTSWGLDQFIAMKAFNDPSNGYLLNDDSGLGAEDNDKKNILAVQSLKAIMGSTLMATTSFLLCSGLAAVISSAYSVKKPLSDTIFGAHGEFATALNMSFSS
ncbi:Plant/F12B17-70 protein [Thalictrum thalictroides]|uniref:Plant/F12B17-70 protein n=1 Tax=Thalictrum thalictroides TaxID=46969 RepID=A0A7J6VXF3_THATH|nr:Plant/F12B17-70 protein [Thalictrum thalictroides]